MQSSATDERDPGSGAAARALKRLPAVSLLLTKRPFAALRKRFGHRLVVDLLRDELTRVRAEIRSGSVEPVALRRRLSGSAMASAVERACEELLAPRPRVVINATGIIVHTNLGRSLLSPDAADQVATCAQQYVDLEYDVKAARRGSRMSQLEPLLSRLFPGQAFLALNNNAAAIMLCLRALSRRKEVLISRGELVEIGGSFRVPDILAASGARLREVGTTNRTRLADYEAALSLRSGMILKVHTSNFKIVGFTEEAPISDLARLASLAGLPLVVDWGSGDLVDLEPLGIRDEMPVNRILDAGADLVTFSGDKLLGGPQAGIIVGSPERIERLRHDPMARICRLDRLLIAALQRTLAAYVRGRAFEEVPTLRMLALPASEIGRRAARVKKQVARATGQGRLLSVIDGVSRIGGGSSPHGGRPTRLLALRRPGGDAGELERKLRSSSPPVIGRLHEGRLLLDLRTVLPSQDSRLAELIAAAVSS